MSKKALYLTSNKRPKMELLCKLDGQIVLDAFNDAQIDQYLNSKVDFKIDDEEEQEAKYRSAATIIENNYGENFWRPWSKVNMDKERFRKENWADLKKEIGEIVENYKEFASEEENDVGSAIPAFSLHELEQQFLTFKRPKIRRPRINTLCLASKLMDLAHPFILSVNREDDEMDRVVECELRRIEADFARFCGKVSLKDEIQGILHETVALEQQRKRKEDEEFFKQTMLKIWDKKYEEEKIDADFNWGEIWREFEFAENELKEDVQQIILEMVEKICDDCDKNNNNNRLLESPLPKEEFSDKYRAFALDALDYECNNKKPEERKFKLKLPDNLKLEIGVKTDILKEEFVAQNRAKKLTKVNKTVAPRNKYLEHMMDGLDYEAPIAAKNDNDHYHQQREKAKKHRRKLVSN